jgi:DNA polymerase III subunit beta
VTAVESFLGIGELARASGLPVSALRFYDGAGVLVPAAVDPRTGYRRYAAAQVADARLVARLRRVGLPLPSVRALLAGAEPGPVLDAHLARLEGGLVDARRELAAVRALLTRTETPMDLTLDAGALAGALDAVRAAAGTDPAYPQLHGVLLDRAGDRLHLVATDRHRLAVATVPVPAGPDGRVVLPTELVDAVRPLLTGTVRVAVGADTVEIAAGDRSVRGPVLADGFPDWRSLEPAPLPHQVALDGAAFRASLSGAGETVVLSLGPDGGLTVGGSDGLRVAVNRGYLLDALPATGQLTLELDSPVTPLAVRLPGGDWSLLMPIRLEEEPAA